MADYAAPPNPQLQAVLDFVNTVHFEKGEVDEHLGTPADLTRFFRDSGLVAGDVAVKQADLRRAVEIREAIRALLRANNGEPLDPEAVEMLNRVAARSRVVAAFDDHASWSVQPTSAGIDGAYGRLLAAIFRAMSEGDWERMKACGNDECTWAMYDPTKNRSMRWCEMSSCGNRMKARRFRERARDARAR